MAETTIEPVMELITEAADFSYHPDIPDGLHQVAFTIPDYVVFVVMLTMSFGIGVVSGFKSAKGATDSTSDYLLGARTISPFAVALSLLGGSVSAIAILGNATEVYFYGTQYCTMLLGMAAGGLMVYHVILPVLYNLGVVSLNQYLELRFGSLGLRRMASLCLILSMILIMAVILYAPSLALTTVTGLSSWSSVLIMGGVCTLYTTIGGVRGVVYTDVLQTTIMYLGVVVVLVYMMLEVGGIANVWDIASQGSRTQLFELDPNIFVRHSLWSTSVLGFYLTLYFYGINQAAHQRFCSVKSLAVAKRLCMTAVIGCLLLFLLCFLAGLTAYAVYSDCDPMVSGRIKMFDQILPYMVADKLGHLQGVPGLFVAAVYGGVLSSVSSCCNSIACLVWDDFFRHNHYFKSFTSRGATNILRALSFVSGMLGLLLAQVAGQLGTLIHLANKMVGAINGPLIGLYLTGICTPWVGHKGAGVGFLTAFLINIWYLVGNIMMGKNSITPLALSTDGCPVNFTITTIITTTTPAATTIKEEVTQDVSSKTLYDVSYCYLGMGSIIVTLFVSSLATICIGMLSPWEVEENLAHPRGVWLHRFLWKVLNGHKSGVQVVSEVREARAEEGRVKENVTTFTQLPLKSSQHLTQPSLTNGEAKPVSNHTTRGNSDAL